MRVISWCRAHVTNIRWLPSQHTKQGERKGRGWHWKMGGGRGGGDSEKGEGGRGRGGRNM
jgi:hypothetical protein